MLRTHNVSTRTTEKDTKMYYKSVATDTKMKLVYRGVPYTGGSNTMDRDWETSFILVSVATDL